MQLQASFFVKVADLKRAVKEATGLSYQEHLQKPGMVEVVMESLAASSVQDCCKDVGPELREQLQAWVEKSMRGVVEALDADVGVMCRELAINLKQSLAKATEAVAPIRHGAKDNQSWAEGLRDDAAWAQVVSAGKKILKGELAVKLCNGVADLQKVPRRACHSQLCLWSSLQWLVLACYSCLFDLDCSNLHVSLSEV